MFMNMYSTYNILYILPSNTLAHAPHNHLYRMTVQLARDGMTVQLARDGMTVQLARDGMTVQLARVAGKDHTNNHNTK